MKLSHLRDVLAVAECGSLRAAGRHLNIAQPAVTRSIHEIERELGVSLFERNAKGVKPTQMGEAFLRRARAIESEIRRATEEIEQLKGKSSGRVSVAMSSASCVALMPKAIRPFRCRYPNAVLRISEGMFQSVETRVMEGEIDFYVGPIDLDISNTHLHVEELFENDRVVAARRGHPLQNAQSITELMNAQWLRPAYSTRSTEADFDVIFARLGLPAPDVVMHAQSTLIALLTLANSDLLTIMPEACLDFQQTAEGISPLRLKEKIPGVTISIVRRHDMPLTPMAELFCDLVRRAAVQHAHRTKKLVKAQ